MTDNNGTRRRRRRSRHRRRSLLKKRVRIAIAVVILVAVALFIYRGLTVLLGNVEERRHIYATLSDCGEDYARDLCSHMPDNGFWYGPWYEAKITDPSPGPDATDPRYRNLKVLKVVRRDPKKQLLPN